MTVMQECYSCKISIPLDHSFCHNCGTEVFGKGTRDPSMEEKLADLIHFQWSHWMRYMLRTMQEEMDSKLSHEMTFVLEDELKCVERWSYQMRLPYEKLSESEKESDREWARRMLNTVRTGKIHYTKVAADAHLGIRHGDQVEFRGAKVFADMSAFPHEVSLVDTIPKPMMSYTLGEEELERFTEQTEEFRPRGEYEAQKGERVDDYTCPSCGAGLEVNTKGDEWTGSFCFECLWEDSP